MQAEFIKRLSVDRKARGGYRFAPITWGIFMLLLAGTIFYFFGGNFFAWIVCGILLRLGWSSMKIGIWGSQTLTGEATPDEGTVLNKGTIKGESVKPSRMGGKTRWALIILGVYTSYAMYTYFRSPYATTIWPISWTRSIRGVVYDTETKEPLRNIEITVSRSFHIFGPHSKQFTRIIRTDERGQYRVPGKFILNPVGGFTGMTLFVEHTSYDALGRIAVDKDHGWALDGGDKVSLSRHFRDWIYKYDRDDARDILLTERQDGDFVCDFPMKRKIKGSNETQSK